MVDEQQGQPSSVPTSATNVLAQGVLPDPVIRDVRAQATFAFIRLADDVDRAGVLEWLKQLTELVREISPAGGRSATVACGFGPSFFTGTNGPRFGLASERHPAEFAELPPVSTTDPLVHTDVVLYVMSTSEALVARLLQGLAKTRPKLAGVTIARGFQRGDGRELAGFRDGLRNTTSANRASVVFIDREEAPNEPDWLEFGTYGVYLRVREDVDALTALPLGEQEKIFGRRRDDGSRLDLPAGSDPRSEGALTDALGVDAHTPKAGPRGDRDSVAIFRRGVPYVELAPDGSLVAGLHFVSFQRSLMNFQAILNRWMLNPNFPRDGAGVDALFARGFAAIERVAFFVVPPADARFIGAPIFDPPKPPRAGVRTPHRAQEDR
jgi:Dyp-type peroxidase family